MSGGANLIQTHTRIEGSGVLTNPIELAPEDTDFDVALSFAKLFIRIKITNAGSMSANNAGRNLEFQINGGGFNALTATSSGAFSQGDNFFADDIAVNEELTNDGGTYQQGQFDDVNGSTSGISLNAGNESESVWSITLDWGALNNGDTIDFRRSSLTTYTQLASITVVHAGYYSSISQQEGSETYLLL